MSQAHHPKLGMLKLLGLGGQPNLQKKVLVYRLTTSAEKLKTFFLSKNRVIVQAVLVLASKTYVMASFKSIDLQYQ